MNEEFNAQNVNNSNQTAAQAQSPFKKVLEIAKTVLWGICVAVLAFLFVVVGWMAVDKFIIGSPVPSFCGFAPLTIETGSMSGTIEEGDMIIIQKTDDYKIGDIITFLPKGDTIPTTHRIINYNNDGTFVTKGDANNSKDTISVSQDIILGEVILIVPKVGVFAQWMQEEGGWIYLVAVAVILCLGGFILHLSANDIQTVDDENSGENG